MDKLWYRWAQNALFQLKGHGEWENELRVLDDKDICGLTERMLSTHEEQERSRLRDLGIIDEAILDPASSDAVVAPGEGRQQLSWLWYSPSEIGGDTNIESLSGSAVHEGQFLSRKVEQYIEHGAALKIEWSKARARKLQWREEVELVLEEMRRVIAYQEW